ncbi:MAG: ABC transporter ATP-binding protein/permease [Lachnospiraceae bacterium]|nr:ABC transporter ATP-binding protein/permease [Lachnospiraceae bacterium]
MMWKYIKRYLPIMILAALLMVGEVLIDLIQPNLMSRIVDEGVLGLHNDNVSDLNLIVRLGFRMIALVLLGCLCGSLNNVFCQIACQNTGNLIRKDCFHNIMMFSFPQTERFGTGSLVTRMTNDITQIQNLLSTFIRGLIRTAMFLCGSIFFMFRINVQFGLIVLCATPFIIACMAICLIRANPLFSRLQEQLDSVNSIMQEDVSGIRIIKACVKEGYERLRFGKANEELVRTQLHVLIIFAFMNPVVNAVLYIVIAILLLAGSYQVDAGMVTPGNIMAGITYATQLLNGMMMLIMLFQNFSRGIVSWRRVKEILQSEPEIRDGESESAEAAGRKGSAADTQGDSGCSNEDNPWIEFRNVSFRYPESGKMILEHMNLSVRRGETLAIMGATGCGKTTLISLVPRFYDVTEGTVLVKGIDVREYRLEELRDNISFVLQKNELFSESVRGNIAWGYPEATDGFIRAAARTAQAEEFIVSLPEKYDTVVAERGMNLSGGQKQRIAIARAVLKPAEILIFDDSTSALDLKTEANLYDALEKEKPQATIILVAQRIATVRRADRIAILENGTISDCGSHDELMQRSQTYRDIYYSQIGEEEARNE